MIDIAHEFRRALDGERARTRQRDVDALLQPAGPAREYEMRVTPEFNDLKLEIWNTLKDEIVV